MLSHIKKYLRVHFGFSKSEARGTLVLLISISCLLVLGTVIKTIKEKKELANTSLVNKVIIDTESLDIENIHSKTQEIIPKSGGEVVRKILLPKCNKAVTLKLEKFDINTVTAEGLRSIQGIGEVLSLRIIKFRNKLGGFISIGQCEEVYGLEREVIKRLSKQIFIEKDFAPKKININTATIKELVAHPYMSYECSKIIVRYREKHGCYSSIKEVSKFFEKNNIKYKKAAPYLTV
jgi:DNA uptake protein ComE-like DNA-binding protein